MIFARVNLKMKTPASLRSVRLCLNIHVSALMPEELHRPGGQQTSVVRNALIILVEMIGFFSLELFICFYSLLIAVVKTLCVFYSYAAVTCPYNMVHSESGSPCMDTCSHKDTNALCEEHNTDGCFCPPGQYHYLYYINHYLLT